MSYLAALPPPLGPRIVFFTGGTALRALSQELSLYTHNSVHLVTPFDSGGSSAVLRRAFHMLAVGDVRNRLLALADRTLVPPEVLAVWNCRLPVSGNRDRLLQMLYALASARDIAWARVPRVFGEVLRVHLRYFLDHMPPDFDPRCACVGNLLLVGGYLHHNRQLGPVIDLMTRLLHVRGTVLPIIDDDLHLAAYLEDGSVVLGQHRITAQGDEAVPCPVREVFLTRHVPTADMRVDTQVCTSTPCVCSARLSPAAGTWLRAADAICYPMGSFYTSVMANLLPEGVGRAVADAHCPKLYIPNSGEDPEQRGMSVAQGVSRLLQTLRKDAGDVPAAKLLRTVLVDSRQGVYAGGIDAEGVRQQGVALCDVPLVTAGQALRHDPVLTAAALLEQCQTRTG
ncbi:MAG: GAK system CofD-like protein [Desulfovibrionaceae bacterium]